TNQRTFFVRDFDKVGVIVDAPEEIGILHRDEHGRFVDEGNQRFGTVVVVFGVVPGSIHAHALGVGADDFTVLRVDRRRQDKFLTLAAILGVGQIHSFGSGSRAVVVRSVGHFHAGQ